MNRYAVAEFDVFSKVKNRSYKIFFRGTRKSETAMFWKYEKYRTWSYWTHFLYCEDRFEVATKGKHTTKIYKSTAWSNTMWGKDIAELKKRTTKRHSNTTNKYVQRQLTYKIFKYASEQYMEQKRNGTWSLFEKKKAQRCRVSSFADLDTLSVKILETENKEEFEQRISEMSAKVKNEEDEERKSIKPNYKNPRQFENSDNFTLHSPLGYFGKKVWRILFFLDLWKSFKYLRDRKSYARIVLVGFEYVITFACMVMATLVFPAVVIGVLSYVPSHCVDRGELESLLDI